MWPRRPRAPSAVRLLPDSVTERVGRTGGVVSVQAADVTLPAGLVRELWRPATLERLARAYWRYLSRVSLSLLRVVYTSDSRTVVLLGRPLALLRFHAPEYDIDPRGGTVTWRIERGLLVQKSRRGHGHLRICVQRGQVGPDVTSGMETIRVQVEVRNFYPWLRGSGWFSRFGAWLYGHTQVRVHVFVTRGFLRDLARLDLPPSRVGALAGEIVPSP